MAPVAAWRDRRRGDRLRADASVWKAEAVLRPGVLVRLVNIGPYGALVDSPVRLRPGRHAELHLQTASAHALAVGGRIARCAVVGLGPVRYRAAIEFEAALWAKDG